MESSKRKTRLKPEKKLLFVWGHRVKQAFIEKHPTKFKWNCTINTDKCRHTNIDHLYQTAAVRRLKKVASLTPQTAEISGEY